MRDAPWPGSGGWLRAHCALLSLLSLFACGSSSDTLVAPSSSPVRCAVQPQTETTSFSAAGGSGTLRVSANRECAWSVQSESAWLTLAGPSTGQGDGSVRFTVAANGDPAARSAGLVTNDQRLQIAQEGRPCEFRLSSTRETVEASGGRRTIGVEATSGQCTWSSAADVPWISVVGPPSRSGSGEVVFDVAALSGAARTGTLTIAGQRVEVRQGAGCTYATGLTVLDIGSAGGFAEVPVLAPGGCGWTAESRTPWIAIASGNSGTGNGTVALSIAPTDGPPRTGSIIIAGVAVLVEQSSGCRVSISPPSYAAPVAGGSGSVAVRGAQGCTWTASSNVPWIAITSNASGTGDGDVRFTVALNSGPARSATVIIAAQVVSISQPSGCSYVVTPSVLDVAHSAPSSSVSVSTDAGCPWTASSQAGWINLPQTSGAGASQLPVVISANNGPRRSGTVTVAEQTVRITQGSPCTWVLAPPTHDLGSTGGAGNVLVIVDGPCVWTAESTVSWITIEAGASGTGNGLVQFSVAPNPGSARSALLGIAGLDYLVRQGGR